MKNAIAIAAVAGFAAAATAQTLTISISADATSVVVGQTINWTVTASWTGGISEFDYFAAANFNLVASDSSLGTASAMTGLDWHNPSLGALKTGTASGASLNEIFAAQQALFGAVVSNTPFVIGSFAVATSSEGVLSYTTGDPNGNPSYSVVFRAAITDLFDAPIGYNSADVTLNSDSVNITPAPSALALLGLGGLVAGRRRR